MLHLWLIQKHFVWLRIPVFPLSHCLSFSLYVSASEKGHSVSQPLGLLWWTDGQSVRDRLPFQPMRKQDPWCRHGDSCHEWLHPDLQLMVRGFDLCLFGGEGWRGQHWLRSPLRFHRAVVCPCVLGSIWLKDARQGPDNLMLRVCKNLTQNSGFIFRVCYTLMAHWQNCALVSKFIRAW